MNRTTSFVLFAGLIFALAPGVADAEPITYTDSIVASGTLGNTTFTSAIVTFQTTSDTSQVHFNSSYSTPENLTATVTISGVGTATFTDLFQFYDDPNGELLEFYDTTNAQDPLDISASAFATYNLQTPLAPTTGSAYLDTVTAYGTNLGNLNFTSGAATASFTAVTNVSSVPEPSSLMMCGIANVVGLVVARVRRKRVA